MQKVTMTLKRTYERGALKFELPSDPALLEALTSVLTSCRDKAGDFVTLTLARPFKPRTTGPKSQNHHLNGHIMQLCQETGNDYETIKYCIKMTAVEQMGYPATQVGAHLLPKRESDCSTEECAMLIEAAHYLAAELGLILREETE